jgi:hypothetical protein
VLACSKIQAARAVCHSRSRHSGRRRQYFDARRKACVLESTLYPIGQSAKQRRSPSSVGYRIEIAANADRIGAMKRKTVTQTSNRNPELAARVGRALVRAAESARRTARMYGTPVYVWENGRVVAKRP